MKFSLKLSTVIVATLLIFDVVFALNEGGNHSAKYQGTTSLNSSETNYLQNETETGWEENGEFVVLQN